MKIVFMDHEVIDRGDISWGKVTAQGELEKYPHSSREEAMERLRGADAVLIDEFGIDRELMEAFPGIKFIGAAATGYNHIDLECAKERGIAVCNVPAYSTDAVAQHAAALMLTLANRIRDYDRDVHGGLWNSEVGNAYTPYPLLLLNGRSIGIVGYGNIGKQMAKIAEALGMTVNIYSRDPEAAVSSDVVSLHCPLTPENRGMVNDEFIGKMKDGALLINTARGALLDGAAVADALKSGKLAGAGIDVMDGEPPRGDDPLLTAPNCLITPHIAFTPKEIRQRVIDICGDNLKSFAEGGDLNRIV